MITLTDQQNKALKIIKTFLKDFRPDKTKPYCFISGWAGTGKTTLIRTLLEEYTSKQVRLATFTGKAAKVVNERTGLPCSTIHGLIYEPITDAEGNIIRWIFNKNKSDMTKVKLIVLDEVSMVSENIWNDLLKFKKPIVVFGDPFQLPPVSGKEIFVSGREDFLLTEIHRQALENPIVAMSKAIREGREIPFGNHGDKVIKLDSPKDFFNGDSEMFKSYEQILCGTNNTRYGLNHQIREVLFNHKSMLPEDGEKVICLKNNHMLGIMNGEVLTMEADSFGYKSHDGIFYNKAVLDGKKLKCYRFISDTYDQEIRQRGFTKDFDIRYYPDYLETDFAYCITVHKAQGSQYNSGIIIDESKVFRTMRDRWLYTAITRFIDKVLIISEK